MNPDVKKVSCVRFKDNEENEDQDVQDNRRITRAMDKEVRRKLELDNLSIFWLR